jgi:hypothetical protein
MAFRYSPKIVTDGLVLAVDAANTKSYPGSGATVTDLSRRGNTGTLANGMALVTDSVAGLCFDSDGTNDNIQFAESADTKGTDNNAITYECWVKREGTSANASPRLMSTDASDYNTLFVASNGNGILYWRINIGNSTKERTYSSGLTLNEWTHVVGTAEYNGSSSYTQTLYINGQSVSSTTAAASGTWGDGTSRVFAIFGNVEATHQNNNCLNGKVALANVYNRALSTSEVFQNYNATKGRFGL